MENINSKDKRRNMNKIDIIDAAERLLFSKGYNNSTMDEIAKEAGYTKKTLYSYFDSKEDIYGKIIERGYLVLNNLFSEALEKEKDSSEISKIRAMGYSFLEFERDYSGYFKAVFESEVYIIECEELEQTTLDMLQKCIEEGVKKGEITDRIDCISISLILWSSLMGFINTFSRKEKYIKNYFNKDIGEVIEKGLDFILNSIKSEKNNSSQILN
jgi:AcrR family transcriptional regulator